MHLRLATLRLAVVLLAAGFITTALSAQAQPHLLLDRSDFARLNQLAQSRPWAANQRQAILAEADAFPASHKERFGLTSLELPPKGGHWRHCYASAIELGDKVTYRRGAVVVSGSSIEHSRFAHDSLASISV